MEEVFQVLFVIEGTTQVEGKIVRHPMLKGS